MLQQLPGSRRLAGAGHSRQHHHLRTAAGAHLPIHSIGHAERMGRRAEHRQSVEEVRWAFDMGRRAADRHQHGWAKVCVRNTGCVPQLKVVERSVYEILQLLPAHLVSGPSQTHCGAKGQQRSSRGCAGADRVQLVEVVHQRLLRRVPRLHPRRTAAHRRLAAAGGAAEAAAGQVFADVLVRCCWPRTEGFSLPMDGLRPTSARPTRAAGPRARLHRGRRLRFHGPDYHSRIPVPVREENISEIYTRGGPDTAVPVRYSSVPGVLEYPVRAVSVLFSLFFTLGTLTLGYFGLLWATLGYLPPFLCYIWFHNTVRFSFKKKQFSLF
eukprot:SAG31_NODE_730_length_12505_cov_3.807109_13_plen_325_part_00